MSGLLISLALTTVSSSQEAARRIDFSRDVRPILSEHCFTCHGPDEAKRSGGLRLDTPEGVLAGLPTGGHAVVPGKLDESELVYRLAPQLPGDVMPPPAFGKPLKEAQIATLKRWIEEGAKWQSHWAFVAPTKPPVPSQNRESDGACEIDRFVRAALVQRGLSPSAEADRATLLRRVTLDLTGLPPTLEEFDQFLADAEDGAYERAVDRLLASPRYGEHMGRVWLDAARYGDTHGLHLDNVRSMWPYRDWVVRAFNENLPFDDFTVWQLAGDLLPEPTQDQLIASGFNRCNPTSAEGGMIAEEYLTIYAKDRVDTTASIWLGVTMGCAQCHDHKYDPFTQRDYYQLYAFFNSLAESASDENIPNPAPFLQVPTDSDRARLAGFRAELERLDEQLNAPNPALDAREARWAQERGDALARRWLTWLPETATATNGAELSLEADGALRAGGANPAKTVYELRGFAPPGAIERLRLEALLPTDDARLPGRSSNENFVLSELEVAAAPVGSEDFQRVDLSSAVASFSQSSFPIAAILDGDPNSGWAGLGLQGARHAEVTPRAPFGFAAGTELRVRLAFESVHDQHAFARFRVALDLTPIVAAAKPNVGVGLGVWHRAFFADTKVLTARDRVLPIEASLGDVDLFAGDVAWTPEPGWSEGDVHSFPEAVGSVALVRYLWSDVARHGVATLGSDDSVQVWVNGALVHDNPVARAVRADSDRIEFELRPGLNELFVEVSNHGGGFAFQFRAERFLPFDEAPELALTLAQAPERRSDAGRDLVRRTFRASQAPDWIVLADARTARAKELADAEAALPTTMISRDLSTPRPAHILVRGAYDKFGEAVTANVPSALPPLPADAPRNRLALARWLVDPANPLTARVTVNRAWQHFFGRGLVATLEDFGAQGEYPTHPELLDWLAVDFVSSGWDVKALHRALVTSATYRQRAHIDASALERDPRNTLLARASRIRLDAEVLRDQALYVAELLDETMGGPGVRPYQPVGIWEAVAYSGSNTAKYTQGPREHLHRRSLYTFWKRTAPPPILTTFDAPSRESCTLERERTNTPLQALAALNETTFVEASRFLAARILTRASEGEAERVERLFRLVTGRTPDALESGILARTLSALRAEFEAAPARAQALLAVGDLDMPGEPLTGGLGAAELAAWTMLASTVLNLDEVLVRN